MNVKEKNIFQRKTIFSTHGRREYHNTILFLSFVFLLREGGK
jgi:hypothetical protein